MFKSNIVVPAYKNLLGWRQFHDNSIQIANGLTTTETGEYYQQKHPALQLDIIQTLISPNLPLDTYLENTVTDATNEIFNDLLQYRQLNQYGKTLLETSVLLNRYGWTQDTITNQGRFVGMQIRTQDLTGLKAIINEIGLQFSGEETFNLYLFHSSKSDPLQVVEVTTNGNANWNWKKIDWELSSFSPEQFYGGVFVVGYYQDDITSNAINYTNFNWDSGVCGGCNDPHISVWRSIRKNFHVYPLYVPAGSFGDVGKMFDLEKAIYSNNQSFGMNFKFTVQCDLTNFFVQNKFVFKNLLALKVVHKILNDMKFSQQINAIEENIKMMIIRDLEGDIETKLTNIPSQYNKELKAVSFNISGINSKCLGCEDQNTSPTYGVV
jgi:hypothetical protein